MLATSAFERLVPWTSNSGQERFSLGNECREVEQVDDMAFLCLAIFVCSSTGEAVNTASMSRECGSVTGSPDMTKATNGVNAGGRDTRRRY